ncbi:MAG: hypothetical protein EOS66_07945 [Mesorhizobium sp.]|nr:MAG: hypothetical protein EOS66_07945 [Mesorhizobium sp.]
MDAEVAGCMTGEAAGPETLSMLAAGLAAGGRRCGCRITSAVLSVEDIAGSRTRPSVMDRTPDSQAKTSCPERSVSQEITRLS